MRITSSQSVRVFYSAVKFTACPCRRERIKDKFSVVNILLVRQIFQIRKSVVLLVSVFMVDCCTIRTRAYKGFGNQSMHKKRPPYTLHAKADVQIAVMVCGWFQWLFYRVIGIATLNAAITRYLVNSLIPNYRLPHICFPLQFLVVYTNHNRKDNYER